MKLPVLTDAAAAARRASRLKPGTVAALALLCLTLTGCFRVSSDTAALRDRMMKSADAQWDEKIEIGVGGLTLGLARAGLSFVDLEPDAREALSIVRGAEVGVYEMRGDGQRPDLGQALADADKTMTARGWYRVVGVMDGDDLVAIYMPEDAKSPRNIRVCLAVLSRRELVVVSARADLEPLLQIASRHTEWHDKLGLDTPRASPAAVASN